MRRRTALAAVPALVVTAALASGCGGGDAAAPTTTVAAPGPTTSVGATTVTTTVPATTAASTAKPAAAPTVVLEPGGLGFLTGPATIRHLELGITDLATIRTALVSALGAPLAEQDQECGSGKVHSMRWGAISAYAGGGSFSGWFVRSDAKPKVTTADGIGIGTTRAKLAAAHPDLKVESTSLGTEWSTGELGGTLTGTKSTATVDAVFSGDACIAR